MTRTATLGALTAALLAYGFALGLHLGNLHNGLIAASFTAVGLYVIRRRPGNREGRLFVATGVAHAVMFTARQYGLHPGPLPAASWIGWLGVWPLPLVLVLAGVTLMSFPDGHLPARGWRPVVGVLAAVGVTLAVLPAAGLLTPSTGWPARSAICCCSSPGSSAWSSGCGLRAATRPGSCAGSRTPSWYRPSFWSWGWQSGGHRCQEC